MTSSSASSIGEPVRRSGRRPTALLAAAFGILAVLAGCASTPLPPQDVAPVAPPVTASAPAAPVAEAASAPEPAASAVAEAASAAEPPPADAAGAPTDPLRPEARVDLADRSARTDLWTRVRKGFAMPELDTPLVRNRERWYAERPDYVQRMTQRSSLYLFHIVEEIEKRGMPTELALLPFIESAFNPQALSVAKASGMWQFIPSTGKHFELTQNVFRDERRDVLASTRAALDYLEKLYGMFGDWHLALAAYNWGEGSVSRAIAKNAKAGRPTDYLSLKMPAETQLYVPKLQAVKNIVANPEAFSLALPAIENHPYFLSVPIQRDMDVELVAQLAGLPIDEFHALNPSLKRPVILAAGTAQVLLPYDNANQFLRALPNHKGPLASWTAWIVPRTGKPAELAKQLGMSEATLRAVNEIPPRMLVKAGSTLLVPRNGKRNHDVSEHVADNASMLLVAEGRPPKRTVVKARKNDSVASIAQRYRVSASNVAQWNDVASGAHFKAGQSVVVYLPAKAVRAASKAAAKPSKSTTRSAKANGRSGSRSRIAARQ